MSWTKLGILTLVRGAVVAAVATILCLLFPAASPWIIGLSLAGLGVVSLSNIVEAVSDNTDSELPPEYMATSSKIKKAEESIIDKFENSAEAVSDKIYEIKVEREEKRVTKAKNQTDNNQNSQTDDITTQDNHLL